MGSSAAGADGEVAVDGGHDLLEVVAKAAAESDARDEFAFREPVDETDRDAEERGELFDGEKDRRIFHGISGCGCGGSLRGRPRSRG